MIERGTLLEIGDIIVGAVTVRLYLALAAGSTKGLADRLRAQSGGAHPVVFTPPDHPLETGCIEIALPSLAGPPDVRGAVARALGIRDTATLAARAPADARIAVDEHTGAVTIDGVEMAAMAPSPRLFIRALVEANGAPVTGPQCDERLSPARTNAGAAKAAKAKVVPGAKASFALAGRRPPKDLERMIIGTGKGYRVTVKCWIG